MSGSRREAGFDGRRWRRWRRSVARCAGAALAGAAALAFVAPGPAGAQSYEVPWSTIDCGGTLATSAPYTLRGSLGQPDAGGEIAGGTFDLLGGFWPGVRELRRAMIFGDGFEAGNTAAWSQTLPLAPAERALRAGGSDLVSASGPDRGGP